MATTNGYTVIFDPKHPRALTNGCVYEHVALAEKLLGRSLTKNEVVHHLDGDRSNNSVENLLVLERSQHRKLHAWLDRGAPIYVPGEVNKEVRNCEACGKQLNRNQLRFCSQGCGRSGRNRKVEWPEPDVLLKDLAEMSWTKVGEKYGVSDNSVRKWVKVYGLKPHLEAIGK